MQFPVVVETVFDFTEYGVDLQLAVLPIGTGIGGAGQVEVVAVFADRQAAPEIVGLIVLPGETEGRRGAVAQVGFTDGVEQAVIVFFLVAETVRALIRRHHPATQGAAVVQRAGGIDLATVVIPAAGGAGEGHALISGRAFAHHVDRRRRVAGTGDQAGRATDDFHAIKHRQVRLHRQGVRRIRAGQAVVHDVVDVETARLVSLPARAAGLAEEQPRRAAHHVVDAGHVLVVHALASDHRHRLRRFAHGQRQLGRGLHRAGGVGLRVFGGAAHLRSADFGRLQFQRAIGGRSGCGFFSQRRSDAGHADGDCEEVR